MWTPITRSYAQTGPRVRRRLTSAHLTDFYGASIEVAPVTVAGPDLSPMLKNFADTAALDLVIMMDSSVAHLAGALGPPVWVLTNFGAYWLWHEDRNDSPWCASLRLFPAKTWNDRGAFTARPRRRFCG